MVSERVRVRRGIGYEREREVIRDIKRVNGVVN